MERVKARLDLPEQYRSVQSNSEEGQRVRRTDLDASNVDKNLSAGSHRRPKADKKTREVRDELRMAVLEKAIATEKAAAAARQAAIELEKEVAEAKLQLREALLTKAMVAEKAAAGARDAATQAEEDRIEVMGELRTAVQESMARKVAAETNSGNATA